MDDVDINIDDIDINLRGYYPVYCTYRDRIIYEIDHDLDLDTFKDLYIINFYYGKIEEKNWYNVEWIVYIRQHFRNNREAIDKIIDGEEIYGKA